MRAVQVSAPNRALELVERPIPEPLRSQVRIKVEACGICHSDAFTVEGLFPGIQYPRVPGHEVAGIIDAIGPEVTEWKVGQKVGIGWYLGHCGVCLPCRRGDFITCERGQVSGVTSDGGYADYMIAPKEALALIPNDLSCVDAGPLLCAGITTFNALRHSNAKAGDLVAVLGIGGLGHLGVQYAAKMGFRTVAIARGKDKEALAYQLGAKHYIDSLTQDVASELVKLGGAKLILSTVTQAEAVNSVINGLAVDGKLLIVGVTGEPIVVNSLLLVAGRRSVSGWPSGTSIDSQDTMLFSAQNNIRSMNEVYPLEKAEEAYQRMKSGKARFRVVLKM